MITANEIRIGNAIWDDTAGKVRYVTHRIISDIASSAEPLPYSPIPMTPEWLNKFDIKFGEGLGYSYPFAENFNLYLTKRVLKSVECTIMQYSEGDEPLAHIKYVHQFQNLYFALTGKELPVK